MSETGDLKSFYIKILRDNGIDDEITEVKITAPELQGENFCSTCDYVTVHRKNGDPIELFVKRLINNPEYTKMLRELKVFDKEAGFFNKILPELERTVKSRTDVDTKYDMNFGPKCYFANEDTIVLENLVKRGYILLDKTELQDLSQARMVIENMARFHAPSYILLNENGTANEMMSKFPCLEDSFLMEGSESMLSDWIMPCFNVIVQIVQAHACSDRDINLKTLLELSFDLIRKIQDYFRMRDEDICHVINHGDCWNNNMMFLQNTGSPKLSHQIFVDFQGIRVGSPNLDIGYYFFTSLKHDVRRQEWKNLLQLYYDSFVKNVEILKGNVSFSFEEFLADYKIKFVSGFIFGLCMGGMMDALKDVGVGNLEDVEGDLMVHLHKIVQKWMEDNPDKVKQRAESVTNLFHEYRQILSM